MDQDLQRDYNFGDIEAISFTNLNDEEKEMVRVWRNHENVRRWMFTDHLISNDEHLSFLQNLKGNTKMFCWLIKNNSGYIGVLNLHQVDFKNKNSYFGLYTNPDSRRIGESAMLFKIIIDLAFNKFKLHTLRGDTIEGNPILYVHEKFGFATEGRLKELILKEDGWKDVIITALINKRT